MKKVTILKGLPASGKTTWALEQLEKHPGSYKRINKDDIRLMLDGGKWSKDNEKFVLQVRDHLILKGLEEGKHILVDDTNLHPKHDINIKNLVKGKAEVEIRFFQATVEECIKRDLKRTNSVGEEVIKKMYKQFLAPKPAVYEPDLDLPEAIICDLDGTLALLNGRNPYDASSCEEDEINEAVQTILDHYGHGMPSNKNIAGTILLFSGREDIYRPQTESWLSKHYIPYELLAMRKAGDTRKDSIIKKEMFDEYVKDKYKILFVLDDRNQVVEFWRSMGLYCFQVAEGDF